MDDNNILRFCLSGQVPGKGEEKSFVSFEEMGQAKCWYDEIPDLRQIKKDYGYSLIIRDKGCYFSKISANSFADRGGVIVITLFVKNGFSLDGKEIIECIDKLENLVYKNRNQFYQNRLIVGGNQYVTDILMSYQTRISDKWCIGEYHLRNAFKTYSDEKMLLDLLSFPDQNKYKDYGIIFFINNFKNLDISGFTDLSSEKLVYKYDIDIHESDNNGIEYIPNNKTIKDGQELRIQYKKIGFDSHTEKTTISHNTDKTDIYIIDGNTIKIRSANEIGIEWEKTLIIIDDKNTPITNKIIYINEDKYRRTNEQGEIQISESKINESKSLTISSTGYSKSPVNIKNNSPITVKLKEKAIRYDFNIIDDNNGKINKNDINAIIDDGVKIQNENGNYYIIIRGEDCEKEEHIIKISSRKYKYEEIHFKKDTIKNGTIEIILKRAIEKVNINIIIGENQFLNCKDVEIDDKDKIKAFNQLCHDEIISKGYSNNYNIDLTQLKSNKEHTKINKLSKENKINNYSKPKPWYKQQWVLITAAIIILLIGYAAVYHIITPTKNNITAPKDSDSTKVVSPPNEKNITNDTTYLNKNSNWEYKSLHSQEAKQFFNLLTSKQFNINNLDTLKNNTIDRNINNKYWEVIRNAIHTTSIRDSVIYYIKKYTKHKKDEVTFDVKSASTKISKIGTENNNSKDSYDKDKDKDNDNDDVMPKPTPKEKKLQVTKKRHKKKSYKKIPRKNDNREKY